MGQVLPIKIMSKIEQRKREMSKPLGSPSSLGTTGKPKQTNLSIQSTHEFFFFIIGFIFGGSLIAIAAFGVVLKVACL